MTSESAANAALAKGSGGGALSFDGENDYVRIMDDPSLDITSGLTVAAWIYIDNYAEWASIVTKGGFDGCEDFCDNNFTVHQSGTSTGSTPGRLRFTFSPFDDIYRESETTIPLGELHHVAVAHDGEVLRFYLNGVLDGEHALEAEFIPNDDPLHIGADFPGDDEF